MVVAPTLMMATNKNRSHLVLFMPFLREGHFLFYLSELLFYMYYDILT